MTPASKFISYISLKKHRYALLLIVLFILHTIAFSIAGVITFGRMRVEGIDPVCYYSYLHSVIFDGDLDFENEYSNLKPSEVLLSFDKTPEGRIPNSFSIGPAVALAPFYVSTHFANAIFKFAPRNGFSPPYQVSVYIGLAFFGLLLLLLIYKWLLLFFPEKTAFFASVITYFATSAVYYAWPLTFMPHVVSAFFVLLFLYYSYRKKGKDLSAIEWFLWGVTTGLMTLMRWQNLLFMAFIFPDVWRRFRKGNLKRILLNIFLASLGWFIAFFPQMIVWKQLYGSFFTIPQGGGFLLWTRPKIVSILFSTHNGLFSWTPLTLLGILGILFLTRLKKFRETAILLFLIFLLQLYLNSIVRDWHGSWGFGMRRFVNCIPIFGVGIGAFLQVANRKNLLTLAAAGFTLFVIWNYLFLVQYYFNLVGWHRSLTYHEMVGDKFHILTSIDRKSFVNTAKHSAMNGYYDDVEKALSLAKEIDPKHPDIYFMAGQIYASNYQFEKAYENYKRALEMVPGDMDVVRAMKDLRRIRDHFYVYE